MRIELKKVTHSARLSEETPCYAAEVWLDGARRGTTQNHGHGGPDQIMPRDLEAALEAHARTLPKRRYRGMELAESAESLLHAALDRHLEGKRLARMLKGKVVLLKGGRCFTVRVAGGDPSKYAAKPGEEVLNGLPPEVALEKFMAATARPE